jgi:hypothetical protein
MQVEYNMIDYTKSESVISAARLAAQVNLLSIILRLPEAIAAYKAQDEQKEIAKIKLKNIADDPLAKEFQ